MPSQSGNSSSIGTVYFGTITSHSYRSGDRGSRLICKENTGQKKFKKGDVLIIVASSGVNTTITSYFYWPATININNTGDVRFGFNVTPPYTGHEGHAGYQVLNLGIIMPCLAFYTGSSWVAVGGQGYKEATHWDD